MKPYLVLTLLLAASFSVAQTKTKPTANLPKYSCTAGPDEQCASDGWYDGWIKMNELRREAFEELKKSGIQQKLDEAQGIQSRLQGEVPSGYQWDDKKACNPECGRFVKTKPPTTQPPAQTPAPPPAPPVDKK